MNRAYSLLTVKSVDEDARVITGMATTPTADRLHDVVEPEGAQFKLPMPLLWQHDSDNPIGHVTHARVSKVGIEIVAKIAKGVTAEIDRYWSLIKAGLVPGLSIGFTPIEHEFLPGMKGVRFKKWNWLELSAVTIPANSEATIQTVKSIDTAQRAASGRTTPRVVQLNPPGASGSTQQTLAQEGKMKTIAEQISALEAKRMASAARMESVMQKSLDEDRTSDASEQEEFDGLASEVESIDKDLVRLRQVEKTKALTAKPVIKADTAQNGAALRSGFTVKAQPKLPPGISWTQKIKAKAVSRLDNERVADVAAAMYGSDSECAAFYAKTAVAAGTTVADGTWVGNLVSAEGGGVADFVPYLRAMTILGQIESRLRHVPFRTPLITQTTGGQGYWVGEGKAKALTKFDFTRTTLEPLKVANIAVLTEEAIRDSSPKADVIVRDQLAAALKERLDLDFITPSKTAVAGVSPASITNGADTIASSGDAADDVRLDIRALWAKYTAANNPPSTGVWIMSSNNAVALGMMTNPLGQPEFSAMGMAGGTLAGMPVIASDYVGTIVVLANASDIYLADEGGISVDVSREASLEMSDAPAHNSITPTPASLVSMWQTNSVALRAERTINWLRRRDPAVVYLTGVSWGGEVPTA